MTTSAHLGVRVGDKPVEEGTIITPAGKKLLMQGVPCSAGYISVVTSVVCYLLLCAHVCYLHDRHRVVDSQLLHQMQNDPLSFCLDDYLKTLLQAGSN